MLKRHSKQDPSTLLPWYSNHTLSAAERDAVDAWLETRPEAADSLAVVDNVRSAVSAQPKLAPSPIVRQRLLAQIKSRPQTSRRPAWLVGSAVALALLIALWIVVQPGIALQWSVTGDGVSTYRVYRAPVDSAEFSLISEIPVQSDARAYSFTDVTSFPGQTYTYIVQAITRTGQTTLSPIAVGRGLDVLPAQVALILTSLVAGAAAMLLVGNATWSPINRRPIGA